MRSFRNTNVLTVASTALQKSMQELGASVNHKAELLYPIHAPHSDAAGGYPPYLDVSSRTYQSHKKRYNSRDRGM